MLELVAVSILVRSKVRVVSMMFLRCSKVQVLVLVAVSSKARVISTMFSHCSKARVLATVLVAISTKFLRCSEVLAALTQDLH